MFGRSAERTLHLLFSRSCLRDNRTTIRLVFSLYRKIVPYRGRSTMWSSSLNLDSLAEWMQYSWIFEMNQVLDLLDLTQPTTIPTIKPRHVTLCTSCSLSSVAANPPFEASKGTTPSKNSSTNRLLHNLKSYISQNLVYSVTKAKE